MRMLGKMLVVLTGGLFALLPAANAATCKGGKRADSAGRCKAAPAKKAPTKAKVKVKSGKKAKAVAAAPEKGPLYVFIESGGCRILATESSVRRMQEIAVGGAVTWDGRCAEGLISGTGVLRQEGVFIEGGRSKHFAYYYSGRAKNGVRMGPWTRETLERFDDSVRSWTSLARVEFVNGVAKGAPKPVPVRGADQHSKSFTTRVLDPEAKRAQAVAATTPAVADADALSLRAAPAVATVAPAAAPAVPPPSIPAPATPTAPSPTAPPAVVPAPTPAPLAVIKTPPPAPTPLALGPPTAPTPPKPAVQAPVAVLPAPAPEPVKATAVKPASPPVAPAPTPVPPAPTSAPPTAIKMPPPAPIPPVSVQAAPTTAPKPAVPATVAAPPPQVPEPAKVVAAKSAPPPVAPAPTPVPPVPTPAPAAVPKAPPAPAPVVALPAPSQSAPAKPAVVAASPPATVKLTPALPDAMEKQAFGFGTGCYMDTLDGQLWENAVLTVKDRKSLRIDGWAVDDEERVLAEATYLRLEGSNGRRYHAATTAQERPDVARHFGTPAFVKAGYRAVFSAEGLPPGEYEVTVVMNSKGRNVLCGNGRRLKL